MSEWPLWEIFIRSQHGLAHKHVGSLHAPDAEMAVKNARDVYTRRNEGVSIWVVRSADVLPDARGSETSVTTRATSPLFDYALRFADSDLVLAQRLGEWIGKGPVL